MGVNVDDQDPRDILEWLEASGVAVALRPAAADVCKLYVTLRRMQSATNGDSAALLTLATIMLPVKKD